MPVPGGARRPETCSGSNLKNDDVALLLLRVMMMMVMVLAGFSLFPARSYTAIKPARFTTGDVPSERAGHWSGGGAAVQVEEAGAGPRRPLAGVARSSYPQYEGAYYGT